MPEALPPHQIPERFSGTLPSQTLVRRHSAASGRVVCKARRCRKG